MPTNLRGPAKPPVGDNTATKPNQSEDFPNTLIPGLSFLFVANQNTSRSNKSIEAPTPTYVYQTMNSPLDTQSISDALNGPTGRSGHCYQNKSSLAETKHTELTGIESYDDAEIRCRLVDEEVTGFPAWVEQSGCCDDDSMSSLESDEGRSSQRRPIFASHWEKSSVTRSTKRIGPFPKRKLVPHPCPYSVGSDDEVGSTASNSGNTYERTLKQDEGIKASSEVNPDRRSIFARCLSRVEPPLQRAVSSCFSMSPQLSALSRRNALSDSALVVKKSPSCLRSSKYSGAKPVRDASRRSLPVSFNSTVSVVKYEIPQEQWAATGWSSLFH